MGTHPIFETDFDCLTDRPLQSRMSNPSDKMSKLNINAMSFVPGQNFNAPAFVPGGAPVAAAPKVAEVPPPAEPVEVAQDEEDRDKEDEVEVIQKVEEKVEDKPKVEEKQEKVEEAKVEEKVEVEPEAEPAEDEEIELDFVNIVFIGHVDA